MKSIGLLTCITVFLLSGFISSHAAVPREKPSFSRLLKDTKEKNFINTLDKFKREYGIKIDIKIAADNLTPEQISTWSMEDIFGAKEINTSSVRFKILELNYIFQYEYLVFSKTGKEYLYTDKITAYSRHIYPDMKIIPMKDKFLFMVNEFGGVGTGLNNTLTSFYILEDGRFKNILTLSTKGHVSGWQISFDRKFKSEINPDALRHNRLQVEYLIYYFTPVLGNKSSEELFTVKKTLHMFFNEEKNEFIPEIEKNGLTLRDVEDILDHDEAYLYYRYKKYIEELMINGNETQKKWCSEYLKSINLPEVQSPELD